ncbi:GTPase YejR, G3E family protein [Campylobacter sp. RM16187]|nr:GTPase YejR, G3E family protein [Campylobacter sp. RM16187]
MDLKDIFPIQFNYGFDDYRMLMRSILIKSLYDSQVKALSHYKGMHKSNYFNECWTMKFGFSEGVYGLILSEVKNSEAIFILYYFPSCSEYLLDNSSLFEAMVSSKEGYAEKIRNFSSYEELFNNFIIAKIYVKVESNGIFLSLKTKLKDRIYAKDGVCIDGKQIIKKGGIDKNFPSFKTSLAFVNFIHLAISGIYEPDFNSLKIYKKEGEAIHYSNSLKLNTKKDIFSSEICLNMLYGKSDKNYLFDESGFKILKNNSCMYKFLINLKKESKNLALSTQKDRANFFIITGFLGSGKTKFLQNFIEYETAQNRFTGVIQNEIGKIGLDGQLVDANYATIEIDEGCVCCSMAGQIKMAVAKLNEKKPDTILLETTGVANPFNLLSELNEIKDIVNLCSIVTVVDGANFLREYKKSKIVLEQVKAADVILLNKIDLITSGEKDKILQILTKNNRCAEIFETINSELNPNFLLYNQSQTSYIASLMIEGKIHATHLNEGIVSFKKDLREYIDKERFINYIKQLPENFLRIKGVISFENDKAQYVFQFVNSRFDITLFDREKRCDNFLVFIGRDVDEEFYFPQEFYKISYH